MDLLELLGSVNKVSIFFFVLTLGVLGYEFYLFQKEKKKKEKPKIPTFNPSQVVQPQNYQPVPASSEKPKTLKKHKNFAVVIAVMLVAFLGVILFITIQSTQTPEEIPPPIRTRADVTLTGTPTDVLLSENATPSATVAPTTITPTTSQIGGQTSVSTPSATPATKSAAATLTPTQAAVSVGSPTPTSPQSLPVAAIVQPQLFILLLGALTVFLSILY